MTKSQATNIVLYGGNRPANVSKARWAAAVKIITRELQNG